MFCDKCHENSVKVKLYTRKDGQRVRAWVCRNAGCRSVETQRLGGNMAQWKCKVTYRAGGAEGDNIFKREITDERLSGIIEELERVAFYGSELLELHIYKEVI
jgi:hypothetical protein